MKNFDIKTRTSELFHRVLIFSSKSDMYKWYNENGGTDKNTFAAITMPYEKYDFSDGTQKRLNEIGVVLFYEDGIDDSVIVHEMVHAGMNHIRVSGNTQAHFGEECNQIEEDLAYAISDYHYSFTTQIIN